jgi:hypothetical protein
MFSRAHPPTRQTGLVIDMAMTLPTTDVLRSLPTLDEFASSERPFHRRADDVDSVELNTRWLLHLDN